MRFSFLDLCSGTPAEERRLLDFFEDESAVPDAAVPPLEAALSAGGVEGAVLFLALSSSCLSLEDWVLVAGPSAASAGVEAVA